LHNYPGSGLDLGSHHARQERALPIPSHLFLLPAVEYLASTTWRSLGGKDPRLAFEGIEERREFLEKRRAHLGHPGRYDATTSIGW
jgi:hypothetical protein